jgi:hypothetical protein
MEQKTFDQAVADLSAAGAPDDVIKSLRSHQRALTQLTRGLEDFWKWSGGKEAFMMNDDLEDFGFATDKMIETARKAIADRAMGK